MSATVIDIDPQQPLGPQIARLGLPKLPPIILLGDANPELNAKVRAVCSRVLAPIALNPGALIIDNAKCGSCAALMGEAAAAEDIAPPLAGIIPHDRQPADIAPNHSKIIRLPAEWTDFAKYSFQIIDQIANQSAAASQAVAVLIGGSDEEKQAALRCARRGWPIVVIKGSGGLADQIGQATTQGPDGNPPAIPDPDLRRIAEDASIFSVALDSSIDDITHLILGRIAPPSESARAVLTDALTLFYQYDAAANARQRRFRRLELSIISLAVAAALVAILSTQNALPVVWRSTISSYFPHGTLHWFVVCIPIVISIVGAYNGYFRDGIKWILLRGATEALKREIFRFRAQAGVYSDDNCVETSREAKLAAKVRDISNQLEHSEVNKTNLGKGREPGPKEIEFIAPDAYIEQRVQDQISYFKSKTQNLAYTLRRTQLAILVAGGAGTLLAAFHADVWVALATAVVSAFATKLQTDQVENSLVQYNQALAALRSIELWWMALSRWEKSRQKNIDLLVEQTERTLEAEMAGWVQQMQSALEKLTEKEPSKANS